VCQVPLLTTSPDSAEGTLSLAVGDWGGYTMSPGITKMNKAVYKREVLIPQSRSTGKERDAKSGNDYFGARYYASGRWPGQNPFH
jgi:hypothetical protein